MSRPTAAHGKRVARCKSCWSGDCADCSRWTDRTSTCEHRCDVMSDQLALLSITGEVIVPAGHTVAGGHAGGKAGPKEEPWQSDPS